ncbi:hypothetical protein [Desulfosporosinus sp. OT]|uniref:hypothetical protein n=1 Tax=Desulfosporosinus sp. OT TaxID=913865 RepID=UPI001A98F83D|nr:hypothetical protein [Desulfosporosinus sp. OT]
MQVVFGAKNTSTSRGGMEHLTNERHPAWTADQCHTHLSRPGTRQHSRDRRPPRTARSSLRRPFWRVAGCDTARQVPSIATDDATLPKTLYPAWAIRDNQCTYFQQSFSCVRSAY